MKGWIRDGGGALQGRNAGKGRRKVRRGKKGRVTKKDALSLERVFKEWARIATEKWQRGDCLGLKKNELRGTKPERPMYQKVKEAIFTHLSWGGGGTCWGSQSHRGVGTRVQRHNGRNAN